MRKLWILTVLSLSVSCGPKKVEVFSTFDPKTIGNTDSEQLAKQFFGAFVDEFKRRPLVQAEIPLQSMVFILDKQKDEQCCVIRLVVKPTSDDPWELMEISVEPWMNRRDAVITAVTVLEILRDPNAQWKQRFRKVEPKRLRWRAASLFYKKRPAVRLAFV